MRAARTQTRATEGYPEEVPPLRAGARRAGAGRLPLACAFAAVLLRCAPLAAEAPLDGASHSIRRSGEFSGGLQASAAGVALRGAVGELAAAESSGAAFKVGAGFMPLSAQPGTVTSIVAVSKTTGTLELAWTAPGLDGFVGDVAAGRYRIDVSPDPSHVFAPTTFTTEFSTSVRPGERQSVVLQGLQPNTTYYSRVYLADARRACAEDSAHGEDPTLARPPASPVVSGVFFTSVTFTWALPAQGAEAYRIDGSSTSFGSLSPGGVVVSSLTRDGLAVTLAVMGLDPDVQYYFRLGSLNWRDDVDFTTLIPVRTRGSGALPIADLAALASGKGRNVRFTWTNPAYPYPAGVMVLMSTSPITSAPADGQSYPAGTRLGDDSVVASSAAGDSFAQAGLLLDTTYYFGFYSKNITPAYSVAVSTSLMLDLPPMAPAGLQASVDAARTRITLSWTSVGANLDGTGFFSPAAPRSVELAWYDLYRATGIVRSNWVWIASGPASAVSLTADIPDPAKTYYYKVVSQDVFGETDRCMAADTDRNLYAVGPDQITRLEVPAASAGLLLAGGNASGRPLVIRAEERPEEVGGKVVKSVRFDATPANSGAPLDRFQFSSPDLRISLRYEVEDGQVVSSAYRGPAAPQPSEAALPRDNPRSGALALAAAPGASYAPGTAGSGIAPAAPRLAPAVGSGEASRWLGAYWHDGSEYIKLLGDVDTAAQTVNLRTALPGAYQIRSVYRPSDFTFDLGEISNKVITPNGDGLNDYVVFRLNNPQDSAVSGKIYDVRGAFVADMTRGTQVADSLVWDGKSGGRVVPRGVYVYQIKAEGKVFNGTVVVIR